MSDVIMQYDHQGRVYARNRMGKGKQSTLDLELQDSGFFIAADLGSTSESKKMYEDINAGLVDQMSWAFIVEKDSYDDKEHTRIIERVSKVFDVSAVSIPANPGTKIDSRSWLGGVAERERLELIAQAEKRRKLIFYLKINGGY
jgi:HK97 family phage prohead protease